MSQQSPVNYTLEDNTLHIFKFHDNSDVAADEFMRLQNTALESWLSDGRGDEPFRVVVDISQSGLYPISHTLSYSLSFLRNYQQIPDRYFAYITDNRNDLLLLRQLAEGGGKDWDERRRIYAPDDLSAAKTWLISINSNPLEED